jgi:hypothetical protein
MVSEITNHYLSVLRPAGVVMVIGSSDLTGRDTGWVNCTYDQLQMLFSKVRGHVEGPFFFDYWVARTVLAWRAKAVARALLWSLRSRAGAGLLALAARRMGARVPLLYLATHAQEDS